MPRKYRGAEPTAWSLADEALRTAEAEIEAFQEVLEAARAVVVVGGRNEFPLLQQALARYDGWMENEEVQAEIVASLVSIAADLTTDT